MAAVDEISRHRADAHRLRLLQLRLDLGQAFVAVQQRLHARGRQPASGTGLEQRAGFGKVAPFGKMRVE